jgi:hypothetical protein
MNLRPRERALESVLERGGVVKDMHKTLYTNEIAVAPVSSKHFRTWIN